MVPLHHRAPGLPGAALAGDFTVELICDGVHLHQGILQLVSKAKDPKQICLITDATQGTGMPDGEYALGSTAFIVKNGIARMKETGALAGSTLELDAALRHMMAVSGAKTEDVINMATLVPAREAGQTDRGRIACGCRADLVFFDEAFFPIETIVQGETVWQKH